MSLRQNEPSALVLATSLALFLSLFLTSPVSSASKPVGSRGHIFVVTKVACPADGTTIRVQSAQQVAFVICGDDTLTRGDDFAADDSVLTIASPLPATDSLEIVWLRTYDLIGRRAALHDFRSSSGGDLPELLSESQVVTPDRQPSTPSTNLKVLGTKSFIADVSNNSKTSLSQGLALTLTGDIGKGVTVKGSFSDRGLRDNRMVTRRFSELDNVYLEVESQRLSGVFGSYQLREDRFRYLSLSRSVQGLGVKYHAGGKSVESSISIPPGNFAEYAFSTTDGFYGPYRLQGKNGEVGVAIVENSETVWLNGEKLTRGRDQDYYCDYLRGELYFTGRKAVDNQDRVRVDFEYQRLEYRKTLVTGAVIDSLAGKRGTLAVGYAAELSAKNDPIDFALGKEDITVLKSAGDDAGRAVVSGARNVGSGNGDYVLSVDSLQDSVYVFVGDKKGDYRVTFSRVDNGAYIYLGGGRYQYVGMGKGDYDPVRILPLPEGAQVVTARSEIAASQALHLAGEIGLSLRDRNRFSSLDDGDNTRVAGYLGLGYAGRSNRAKGNLSAEYLPAEFVRLGRLDNVDEGYLWQRRSAKLSDRQRYLGDLELRLGEHDRSRIEGGYTSEKDGFESRRVSVSTELAKVAHSTLGLVANLSSSSEKTGRNRLLELKPSYRFDFMRLAILAKGDYDHRRSELTGSQPSYSSKREGEIGIEAAGVTLGARQRENWEKLTAWERVDRKQSLTLTANRSLSSRGKIDLQAAQNRFTDRQNQQTTYQTGMLTLDLRQLFGAIDINTNLRLSRRGANQTNKTYLKVDDGKGDYVLRDSVYVAQTHGDYILITEQVGTLTPSVEAEKRVQAEADLGKIIRSVLTNDVNARYETGLHEIGNEANQFQARWLVPPLRYLGDSARFSERKDEYRLKRYDRAVGLRSELSFAQRREDNLLDVSRPQKRLDEQLRLLLNQRVGERAFLELITKRENSFDEQLGRYSLTIRTYSATLSATAVRGQLEFGMALRLDREKTDSLNLRVTSLRITPKVSYNIFGRGRVETSVFLLKVAEDDDRRVLLQMAGGFPTGTHCGGTTLIDFSVAENFSFRLTGSGEIRQGEAGRYYLRTELISRFQ